MMYRLSRFERLLRQIAPRDQISQTYVVREALPEHVWGLTHPTFDLVIRARLEASGDWLGRGPAIGLGIRSIAVAAAKAASGSAEVCNALLEQWTLATFCHEAGHVFANGIDLTEPRDDSIIDLQAAELERMRDEPAGSKRPRTRANGRRVVDAQHAAHWVRLVLHAWHRVQLVTNIFVPLPMALALPQYGLSPAWKYKRALGDEPARMIDETFEEIKNTPYPDEFLRLFYYDVRLIRSTTLADDAAA